MIKMPVERGFLVRYTKSFGRPNIRIKKVRLSDLQVSYYSMSKKRTVGPICDSPILKCLVGDYASYLDHLLFAGSKSHSIEKTKKLLQSLDQTGYKGSLITVSNGVVIDGHHRAAICWHLWGDIDVYIAQFKS